MGAWLTSRRVRVDRCGGTGIRFVNRSSQGDAASHIVTIQTQVRDEAAVFAACHRRQLAAPVQGKHRLFSRKVEGLAVQLRDWHYPVVANSNAARFITTTSAAVGASSGNSICSCKPIRSRRPESRHASAGTLSRSNFWPMARSSSPSRLEVPLEDNRDHRLPDRTDRRANERFLRWRMPRGEPLRGSGSRPAC